MTTSMSTPGSPIMPRTSTTRPLGEVGGAVGIAVDLDVDHLAVARVHRVVVIDDDVVSMRESKGTTYGCGSAVKAADDGAVRAAQHLRRLRR